MRTGGLSFELAIFGIVLICASWTLFEISQSILADSRATIDELEMAADYSVLSDRVFFAAVLLIGFACLIRFYATYSEELEETFDAEE